MAINSPATIVNPVCYASSNGSIDITVNGGTTPYTYAWSNGFNAQDPQGLTAANYTVIVTDANGCTTSATYTLNAPAALTLTASSIVNTQCNASVGSVYLTEASATAGSFTVNGLTQTGTSTTFSNLAAGYYTADFTETASGCTATTNFNIININSTLAATVSVANPLCNGGTVTATVNASGGTAAYNYSLNGASAVSNEVFTGLSAGNYNVLVSDTNNCTYYVAFTITQPTLLVADIVSSTNISCYNGYGSATVNATGGATPYLYSWNSSPVQTTYTATALSAGSYTVTVTDAQGCTATAGVSITAPSAALSIQTSVINHVYCFNDNSGAATVNISGGTQPYIAIWSNGSVGNANGLHAGSYTVNVLDNNGCNVIGNVIITEPAGPITAFAGSDTVICSTNNSLILSGLSANSDSIIWTTNGTGTFTNANSLNAIYTPSIADILDGQIQLYITAFGHPSCEPVSDYLVLTIWQPATAFAGNSVVVSSLNSSYTVTGANASNYSALLWTANGTGVLSDETTLTPTYTFGIGESGNVVLTLNAYKQGNVCNDAISNLTITIIPPAIANAGDDDTICAGSDYTLNTAFATNASTILWSTSGTGTFSNPAIPNPTYIPSQSDITNGNVTLKMHASYTSPPSSSIDEMQLTINPNPIVNNFNSIVICKGSYTQLGVTASIGYDYTWTSNPAGFASNISNPVVNPVNTTIYNLTVTNTNTQCSTNKDVLVSVNPDPTVITQNKTIHLDTNGNADITIPMIDNGSYVLSPCNITNMTLSKTHFNCSDIGNNTVILTVYDQNGNYSSDTAIVLVIDSMIPVMANIPLNTTVNCDNIPAIGTPTASDICDNSPVIHYLGEISTKATNPLLHDYYNYTLTRTWDATDASGNHSVIATQVINVQDTTIPILANVPLNATISCDNIPIPGIPTATDNCDNLPIVHYLGEISTKGSNPLSFDYYNYTLTRTWDATDVSGNHSLVSTQIINVKDTISPILANIPLNTTVSCDNIPVPATPTATDNCDNLPIVHYLGEISTKGSNPLLPDFYNYTLTRTWDATDVSGNHSLTGIQIITVEDISLPVISCPSNITQNADSGLCSAAIIINNPTATDNCSSVFNFTGIRSDLLALSATYPVGNTTITWTATDKAGNISLSCNQTITVIDNQNPTITSIGNQVRCASNATNPHQYITIGNEFDPDSISITDNCGILSISNNINTTNTLAGHIFTGITPVTWTVTDINGNINSFSIVVTIDSLPTPEISGDTAVCSGNPVIYTTTNNGNNFSYQWSVSGGIITSAVNATSLTVKWNDNCTSGWIDVTETNLTTGCSTTTAHYNVNVHNLPNPSISGDTLVLTTIPYNYQTTNVSGNLYSWSSIGGSISSGQGTSSVIIDWGSCGNCQNGIIAVTETSPYGCSKTTTYNVVINIASGTAKLSGQLTYDNTANTALNGVNIQLVKNGIIVASTITSNTVDLFGNTISGYYEFNNIAYDNYSLNVSSNAPWGGVTATDALLIKLHSIGMINLTDLSLVAADVNSSNSINATDALLVQLRIVGLVNQFAAGNWKFNNLPFTFNASNLVYNFKGICVGDINKSYITSSLKQASSTNDGIQEIKPNQSFVYDIKASASANLGAMTLFMDFNQHLFEIEKVNSKLDGLTYKLENGKIAFAWSDLNPFHIESDETIISLQIKTKETLSIPTQIFNYDVRSEYADKTAFVLDNFGLKMADVKTAFNNNLFVVTNYPNPAREISNLIYTLPEKSKVQIIIKNIIGQPIRTIVDEVQTEGTHSVIVSASDLGILSGMYIFQIEIEGATNKYSKTGKIVFER